MTLKAECPYCGEYLPVRLLCPPIHFARRTIAADFVCEECFSPLDDSPCWDDLSEVTQEDIDSCSL